MSWGFGPMLPKNEKERVESWNQFTFYAQHIVGDENCTQCLGYPTKCMCGGLIHSDEYVDSASQDIYYYNMCDKCGLEWEL